MLQGISLQVVSYLSEYLQHSLSRTTVFSVAQSSEELAVLPRITAEY